MNKKRVDPFLPMWSEPPAWPLSQPIVVLLSKSGFTLEPSMVIQLAHGLRRSPRTAWEQLAAMEEAIGGVGIHNVNRSEGKWLMGAYRSEFRPLFRPIQYVSGKIFGEDLVWDARHIVQWSCGHVEDSIKYRFGLLENDHASLGILLTRRPIIERSLEPHLLNWLRLLNHEVYRGSKHALEDIHIDSHRFTAADAVAVYLMCRWAGVKILQPTGVFSHWQEPRPPLPL